jgi:DNA-binding response OmpR family regulator
MEQGPLRILIVEDDPTLGLLLNDLLRLDGFKATLVRDGREALPTFHAGNFDLALLDVMLPGRDGFELTEDLRKVAPNLPIVLLTARDRVEDRVRGLKCGADDYVIKPFDNEELLLRLRSVLKRNQAGPAERKALQIGGLRYDPESYELKWDSGERRLTPKEGDVLKILMQRAGRTTERDLICKMVWGESGYFVGRSMDVYITRLRKILKADPQVTLLTIHGVGFRLDGPTQRQ